MDCLFFSYGCLDGQGALIKIIIRTWQCISGLLARLILPGWWGLLGIIYRVSFYYTCCQMLSRHSWPSLGLSLVWFSCPLFTGLFLLLIVGWFKKASCALYLDLPEFESRCTQQSCAGWGWWASMLLGRWNTLPEQIFVTLLDNWFHVLPALPFLPQAFAKEAMSSSWDLAGACSFSARLWTDEADVLVAGPLSVGGPVHVVLAAAFFCWCFGFKVSLVKSYQEAWVISGGNWVFLWRS